MRLPLRSVFSVGLPVDEVVCDAPVQVLEPAGPRLGCLSEPALFACPDAGVGDLILNPIDCTIVAHGMSTPARFAVGLPMPLNLVAASDLEQLPGIGPTLSRRITRHRQRHGPFVSPQDLLNVSGIGPVKLDRLLAQVAVFPRSKRPQLLAPHLDSGQDGD